jgi:hypothetical protein
MAHIEPFLSFQDPFGGGRRSTPSTAGDMSSYVSPGPAGCLSDTSIFSTAFGMRVPVFSSSLSGSGLLSSGWGSTTSAACMFAYYTDENVFGDVNWRYDCHKGYSEYPRPPTFLGNWPDPPLLSPTILSLPLPPVTTPSSAHHYTTTILPPFEAAGRSAPSVVERGQEERFTFEFSAFCKQDLMPSFEMLRQLWVDRGQITFLEEDWKGLSVRAVEQVRTNLWSIGYGVLGLPQRVWPEARDYGLEELMCIIREFLQRAMLPAALPSPPSHSPTLAPFPLSPPPPPQPMLSLSPLPVTSPAPHPTPSPSPPLVTPTPSCPATSSHLQPVTPPASSAYHPAVEPLGFNVAMHSALSAVMEYSCEERFAVTFTAFSQQCLVPAFEDLHQMHARLDVVFLEDHWR